MPSHRIINKKIAKKYLTIFALTTVLTGISLSLFGYYYFFVSPIEKAEKEEKVIFASLIFANEKSLYGSFLCVISPKDKRMAFVSIPSNMALYRSYKKKCVSSSEIYKKYGKTGLKKAIETTFRIKTNYEIVLNNKSIENIIDLIGGINIYIEKPINLFDEAKKIYLIFDIGSHMFTGSKAVSYLNYDKLQTSKERETLYRLEDIILNSAIAFIDRPILRKIVTTKSFLRATSSILKSNLRPRDFKFFGKFFSEVNRATFLMETMDGVIDENGFLTPVLEGRYAVRQIKDLSERVTLQTELSKIENENVSMNVLNGTDVKGLADRINIRMRYRGFSATEYGNFEKHIEKSVILIRNGQIEKGYLISDASKVNRIYVVTDRRTLIDSTLILGDDYYEITR